MKKILAPFKSVACSFAVMVLCAVLLGCSHWHPLVDCEGEPTGETIYHTHYPGSHDGSELPLEPPEQECDNIETTAAPNN